MEALELETETWGGRAPWTASRQQKGIGAVTAFLLAFALGACGTEEGEIRTTSSATAQTERLDPEEVEAWADQVFTQMLEERRFSALAIAVSQDDEVVFQKGYGYADWADRTPVDPRNSQFRIGSLTKTFFGTAIAQLLERGLIDSLDDPVNRYLKRTQVENPFGGEISIWDMLTHQGGMGSAPVFVAESVERPVPPLPADYIAAHTPPVVREPGTVSIYCNPCSATLGFMVEDITGQTLQDYMRENIFEPLGMSRTELTNAPQAPNSDVVTQYAFVPDGPPIPLPYPAISPYLSYAGDMNSSAGDMAKWLVAHIMAGRGDGPGILEPETFDLLHRRKRGNNPEASGFGIQFFTYDYNGERVIEHYGSIRFRSMEIMMLDRGIGVFVTMGGGGEPPAGLADAFGNNGLESLPGPVKPELSHSGVRAIVLEHFLGPLLIPEHAPADPSPYVGVYHPLQANPDAEPSGPGRTVEASGDGGLVIGGLGTYRPSGPTSFTLEGRLPPEAGFGVANHYVFARGPDGRMWMFPHVNAGALVRAED